MANFILDQCEEIMDVIDENTNIIFANEKAGESLGYFQEELLSMQITDVAPDFKEEVLLQFPKSGIQQHSSTTMEMIFKTMDHQSLQLEVKISPYISSQCYFIIVAKDISVYTQLYDLLIHNENEFNAFIENSNDIIIRNDMSFRCIYVNKIIFYVSDTGIGIPVDKHESIFEPFVQVDLAMIRSYEDLGIGMTLARRISKAFGGNIYNRFDTLRRQHIFFHITHDLYFRIEKYALSKFHY